MHLISIQPASFNHADAEDGEYIGKRIHITAADGLAHCVVPKASAMVLTMWDKSARVFHKGSFERTMSSHPLDMIENIAIS